MKGSIILYGVRQIGLRRDIEFFLDDEFEILGCSDGHYTCDVIDNGPFFKPSELKDMDFSYILPLSFNESVLQEMRQELISCGVAESKIIKPTVFLYKSAIKDQIDLIDDIRRNYKGEQGLILGACYTLRDINRSQLSMPFYDCGWHALDLYYNYKILQYMSEHGLLSAIKRVLFVFSYYCFNYDESRTLPQYQGGWILPTWQLDDWHHYREVPGADEYVANFRLFGKKIFQFYRAHRFEYKNPHQYGGEDGCARLNHTWFKRYDETVGEYRTVFKKFVAICRKHGIVLSLIVPPYYLNGIDKESRIAFEQMKRLYYEVVESVCKEEDNIIVYDYASLYAKKRDYFRDIIHLNSAGAHEFTQQINRDILND